MAVNIYEPQFMIEMMKITPPLKTFFRDTFFKQIRTFPTKSVTFDLARGGVSMAPFVSPRIGSTVMERQGYKTLQYTPPLVAPKRVLTTDDLDVRLPGEAVFNGYSPAERAARLLAEDLVYLDSAITLREEWMIAQVLFTGKIPVRGEGVEDVIDFGFTNTVTVPAATQWSIPASSNPIDDLYHAAEKVSESGNTADIAVSDGATMRDLLRSADVRELMDIRHYELGMIQPAMQVNGAMYFGYLAEPGLHLYGYNEKYADNDNVNPAFPSVKPGDKGFLPATYPLIPHGKVFVGSTKMPGRMLYGAVTDQQSGNFMAPRVPKMWDNQEPSERYVKISSRPLPCPMDLSGWVILEAE